MQLGKKRLPLTDRASLERASRLSWLHWTVVGMSLVITLVAWYITKRQIEEKTHDQLERQIALVVDLVSERMQKYEDGLWGGVSAIQAKGGEIDYYGWKVFADSLRIDVKYPGINGIGVIHYVAESEVDAYLAQQRIERPDFRIFPRHESGEYLPITYVEPVALNLRAIGLDMAHETNRYTAAKKARDTGRAQITGPIVLVQDEAQTPGFLFYAPYYAGGTYDTPAERRKEFLGMVYAPFMVHKLMQGTLERSKRQVTVGIRDGDEVLYLEEPSHFQSAAAESFTRSVDLNFYGRTWTFDIVPNDTLITAVDSSQPYVILVGGMLIDSMLLALFMSMTGMNRRAVQMADNMTVELKNRSLELERSNAELDKFAYVASHDLRAPLRAVGQLADILMEDVADLLPAQSRDDLRLIKGRVERMDTLLLRLLEYSRIGSNETEAAHCNLREVINGVIDIMGIGDRFETMTDAAVICAPRAAVDIVFHNLIGNTIKHHDKDHGKIRIACQATDNLLTIIYSDDGPGIPFEYNERVFEMFQTLKSRDDVESSGMGLAMVRKTIISHGGRIELCRSEGRGAVFRMVWPQSFATEKKRAA